MHILSRCFKKLRIHTIAGPAADADPQSIEEAGGEPDKPQSSLYKLASNNPHVIAATVVSKNSK